jgi:hypothetical protein
VARNENVVNTIWDDLDHLGDDAFMLYVWSFTNTKCGMAGMYPVTRRKLIEGRFDDARLDAALAELEADDKLFYVDGVLWNKARVSNLSGYEDGKLSEFIARAIAKDLRSIPPSNPLLSQFLERYGSHPKLEGPLTPFRPSGDPLNPQSSSQIGRPSSEGLETLTWQGQGRGQGQCLDSEVVEGENNNDGADEIARRVCSILQGGIDGLSHNDHGRPWRSPEHSTIAGLITDVDSGLAEKVARDVREIVQSQDRAPNVTKLFEKKLGDHLAEVREAVRGALADVGEGEPCR